MIRLQKKLSTGYDYINAKELSELLGVSIKTIYGKVYNRQIPYYKPGGKTLMFKMSEIQEWIKSGRHSTIEELKEII
ncbi:helix-turn-helix domain-containing protein [Carboxylicivirga sp. A043]|uniref:Helix-turn-helix domain-containing protein n=1 Tax=Carboxylicivirga sediminis TaxID=2006564 RepID=A0A941F5A5_9BACT|nr:helix-turn-helix domain-containing protein [Carboxylicivirga sediminis]MBR8536642.1 helix-turn-helix domain-containing protein [Carboxylicivirga sediminis]MCU4158272.1 helix-turn-helix domain-containing protein [Carboxylicivirga sp. A043]